MTRVGSSVDPTRVVSHFTNGKQDLCSPSVGERMDGMSRRIQRICSQATVEMMLIASLVFFLPASFADASALPDARVYERVSPAETNGGIGGVFPLGSLVLSPEQVGRQMQSSLNGEGVTYLGEDFFQAHLGSVNQYLSQHSSQSWLTQNLTPAVPLTQGETAVGANPALGFAPDLSAIVISSSAPLAFGAPQGFRNLYLINRHGTHPLIGAAPLDRTPATFGRAWYGRNEVARSPLFAGGNSGAGSAPAFTHLLFEVNDALETKSLTKPVDGGKFENNLYEWTEGGLRLVNVLPNGETHPNASFGVDNSDVYIEEALPSLSHVISADGSKIFWTDESEGHHNLYVREDGTHTLQIDEAVGGGGEFQTASGDGSKVIFTKEGGLYQFDTDSKTTSALATGVLGVLGASNDGSYVYFVSTEALVEGAVAGKPNLYLSHEGGLQFIATLTFADNETPNLYGTLRSYGDWYRTFAGRTSEVSPNGRYVAFMAKEELTGYDNHDKNVGRTDYEVFLYDAETHELICPSCNTDGSQPTSHTLLPAPLNGTYQQHYLNDKGQLFFSTEDSIIPQDINNSSDVYEYEDGKVYLLSPGNSSDDTAVFGDASESGNDVFFTTQQQLVPGDLGEITDLYDARVYGNEEVVSTHPSCSDEACRTLTITPPIFVTPISAGFTGAGNLITPPSQSAAGKKRVSKTIKRRNTHKPRQNRKKHGKRPRKIGRRLK
jgi:hypothetical protein